MSETYYIGIDLGTSRTSIATSTGKRYTTVTCTGYTKDIISKKRFGRNYLLGNEAIENRLALDMVWPLADGVINEKEPKAIQATKLIIENVINKTIPDKSPDDKLFVAIGVPGRASIENKKILIEVTKNLVDKLLVVSEPFAVAYSLDQFEEALVVDIGAGTTDLCVIHGVYPDDDDQTMLFFAGNFLDDVLTKNILEKFPDVQLTSKIIRNIKEKYGFVSDVSDKVEVTLTEQGIPRKCNLTSIMRSSCLCMTDPICKEIQKMVGNFDADFQERLRNNVILAGGGSNLRGIDRAVEKGLEKYGGGNATVVTDTEFTGATGTLKMALEMPEEYWEKI